MAKKDKKKVSKIKTKKKLWYKVIAPKIFGNKEIGESYLQEPTKSIGRKFKVNLKELTGNFKDQNVYMGLQISKVNGTNLNTSVVSYELNPTHIKRQVRKNTGRMDGYHLLKTKGGKEVILKSLVVTLNKTQRSIKTNLNKQLDDLLREEISQMDFTTFVTKLVNHQIQIGLKKKLKKIYPLKDVSVKVLKLKGKGPVKEEVIVEDNAEKEEEEQPKEEKSTE